MHSLITEKMFDVFIVGNRFENFADQHENVICVQDLEQIKALSSTVVCRVKFGQGIDIHKYNEICQWLSSQNIDYEAIDLSFQQDAEFMQSVHKHKVENIAISPPIKVNETEFFANLHLQNDCAELNDHMTGQHIQGMALTEAARQMMLSSSELFLLPEAQKNNCFFILQKISSEYQKFVFPLPCQINFNVLSKVQKPKALEVCSRIDFIQDNEIVTQVHIDFIACIQGVVLKREHTLAKKSIQMLCDNELAIRFSN